jgi:hypothetical protein
MYPLNVGLPLRSRNGDVLVLLEDRRAVLVPANSITVSERYSLASILRASRETRCKNLIPDSQLSTEA